LKPGVLGEAVCRFYSDIEHVEVKSTTSHKFFLRGGSRCGQPTIRPPDPYPGGRLSRLVRTAPIVIDSHALDPL